MLHYIGGYFQQNTWIFYDGLLCSYELGRVSYIFCHPLPLNATFIDYFVSKADPFPPNILMLISYFMLFKMPPIKEFYTVLKTNWIDINFIFLFSLVILPSSSVSPMHTPLPFFILVSPFKFIKYRCSLQISFLWGGPSREFIWNLMIWGSILFQRMRYDLASKIH